MMPDRTEDHYRMGKSAEALGLLDNLIPHGAEVVLQFRKSTAYVEFGKFSHNVIGRAKNEPGMACKMDQVDE